MTLSNSLHIVNPNEPCTSFPEKPSMNFLFSLDPFQQHAVAAIHNHENVLVTAKTGSGKTLVGEYQIAHSLSKGRRVFYTTPIKSLSNQKFHDLKEVWGDRVGIMTGDIKFKPEADIVIMTTEILRNLLFKYNSSTRSLGITASLSLENLDAVVFDEVHYINNKERGRVWEETMILLPRDVNLVLLSATIDSPELFASWLGDLKQKPIHLISTTYRIVPLTHAVLRGKNPYTIMDHKEKFYPQTYNDWLKSRKTQEDEYKAHQKEVANRRLGGYEDPVAQGQKKGASFTHQLNETIQTLHEKELLPALFFVLSRKGCENYAKKIEGSLLTTSDSAQVKHVLRQHLHRYPSVYEATPQYFELANLLERGIAYHHSGVLPLLKEMIEILFSKGLIKVLFATETFAVGINMPTKTVVFTGFEKYDEDRNGMRVLYTDEYIQMAGRAGRRGKDKEGLVLYLPEKQPITLEELKTMMTGAKSSFISRMSFHYDFILKTLQSGNTNWISLMENSYWYTQHQKSIEFTKQNLLKLQAKMALIGLTETVEKDMAEREMLETLVKTTTNAKKKEAQRNLSIWQNKHQGPAPQKQWEAYKEFKVLQKQISALETEIRQLEEYKESLYPIFEYLAETGFLKTPLGNPKELTKECLTERGILATEINEAHPLLLTRIFEEGICSHLSGKEILAILASFVAEKEKEVPLLEQLAIPKHLLPVFYKIDDFTQEYMRIEKKYGIISPNDFWSLNTAWIEPVWRWIEGGETAGTICEEYGIYAGNFVRGILKVSNILEEWTNLATYTKNVEMLQKLEGLQEKLVRDLVVPESLYLRI